MSYIEHGPRIFRTGRSSNVLPSNFGDYVLPRKRSEGRLKMYDSCSDIRAWSPNPLENSRYFRELAEHAPKPGKIVPFNVLIDNLIKMGSQTQKELELVKKELEKYKCLRLTPEQKEELKRLAITLDDENEGTNEEGRSLSRIIMDTFLNNPRDNEDPNHCFSAVENKDASIQVQIEVSESAVQHDPIVMEISKTSIEARSTIGFLKFLKALKKESLRNCIKDLRELLPTVASSIVYLSCFKGYTPFVYYLQAKFSSTTSNSTMRDGRSFCSVNSEFETTEISGSESENSKSPYESEVNRAIIIEKDSKIIALENEVEAKNAELEEKSENMKHMRMSVRSIKNVLDQKCHEIEDLRTKLQVFKFEKRKLQDSLDNQSHVSEAQLEEISRLRFRVNQDEEIRIDLSKQLEQMRREREGFKRKVDMLHQEIKEKNEILNGSEQEFHELFLSWQRTSEEHEKSKTKTMEVLKVLESEIEEKNSKISGYEAQIFIFEQEVGDMFVMLQTSLSEIEFIDKQVYEYIDDTDEEQNIILQTKATVSNVNLLMKHLEMERKDLKKQLDDMKNKNIQSYSTVYDRGTYVNNDSSMDYDETSKENEIEIRNLDLDRKKNLPINENPNNLDDSQEDRVESQVTDQESTIEMWNCSFDNKIDSAFENHVTTSIIKIRKITEAFKDVGTEKLKEIEELKFAIEKRDSEITKLRKEINEQNSKWKGEGDCYDREIVDRNKRELEMEEKLYSYQHKLLGVNEENFTLRVKVQNLQDEKDLLLEKYEKSHKEVQFRIQDLAMIKKYKKKVEEMLSSLRALQDENSELINELSKLNETIVSQKMEIQNLLGEKDKVEDILYKYKDEIQSKNHHIKNLKEKKFELNEKLQKAEVNVAKFEKLKYKNNRKIEELTQLQKEVKILNEEKIRLSKNYSDLNSDFMKYQKQNVELEREINDVMQENKNLRSCIDILKIQFEEVIAAEIENKIAMEIDYFNKMINNIALLKGNCENQILEEEKKYKIMLENKSKSEDPEFELNFTKDLSKEKEKNHLENESRQKEDEIEKLKHEIDERNLKIKNMEEKHEQTLITVTRKKDEEMKNLRNLCDQKIKKLEDNFSSWNSDGFSFGTENWLKSLSTDELTTLCQRIFSMLPPDEYSKTMNNKQNNYLQQDMSEKQKLIEKVKELEDQILNLKQNTAVEVEELELKIQQERCDSTKLRKRLYSFTQNQRHNEMNRIKKGKQGSKSFYLGEVIGKEPNFRHRISNQDCIKATRLLYNKPEKRKNYPERKFFSGDESNDSRRKDFIDGCSASMRHK